MENTEAREEVIELEPVMVKFPTAARLLDCSESTVRKLVRLGKLRTVKVSDDDRITIESIKALAAEAGMSAVVVAYEVCAVIVEPARVGRMAKKRIKAVSGKFASQPAAADYAARYRRHAPGVEVFVRSIQRDDGLPGEGAGVLLA